MTLQLTVSRDIQGATGLINLPVREVIFVQSEEPSIVKVHTTDAHYYAQGTASYFEQALKASGFNFYMVDKGCLVNTAKINRLDGAYNIAYFEGTTKSCYISRRRKVGLLDILANRTINGGLNPVII